MARQLNTEGRAKYRQKTPEGKARSIANLKLRHKGKAIYPTSTAHLSKLNIIEFAVDVLGLSFKKRPAQEVLLRAMYGLPLSKSQLIIYKHLTDNDEVFEDGTEKTEGVWALGARGGKSFLVSICALFEATCRADRWRKHLLPNEIGYVVIIATRLQQAQAIIGANCARMLEDSKIKSLIAESWSTELRLKNGITIMSLPCNSTAGRGLPICCLIFDEIAHFRVEGVKADENIYSSLRPRQVQFPSAKLMLISTPSAKQGLLWQFFSEGSEVAGRLTAQASTLFMNPEVSREFIERERRRNPDNAAREFDAEFAEKVDMFFPYDKLMECFSLAGDVAFDARLDYFAGVDQSGLAGRDRFGFAIAHRLGSKDEIMVDCVRSWGTKDSEIIKAEIKNLMGEYNIRKISIDKYGSGWVRQFFEKMGFEVIIRDPLPVIYANTKSLVISGRLLLPDNKELRDGLMGTQAYYSRSNTLSIGHERSLHGHADLADAVVTAVFDAAQKTKTKVELICFTGPDPDDEDKDEPEGMWRTLSEGEW